MSAIVGLLCRDGAPADAARLDGALAALAPFGEQRGAWAEGPVALGQRARPTTPEAERERWPLHHPAGLTLVADARLDNRDELRRALRLPEPSLPPTDGELILAAHERWGDGAPARLVGDYAYALWDRRERSLLLVRSVMGLRGLFYRESSRAVAFATTLRAAMALGDGAALNEPWVASFFVQRFDHNWAESPLVGILKVPPGHSVRISAARGAEPPRPFWQLERDERGAWPRERQREALRAAYDEAVAALLRSNGPLAIGLSGGLDSSSVALTAHDLMHGAGGASPVAAHTQSLVMPGFPAADEALYREAAAARLPAFEQAVIPMERAWDWPMVERWAALSSVPAPVANAYTLAPLAAHAHAVGARAILSGVGGDLLTGGEDYRWIESFRSLPWGRKRAEARRFWRSNSARGLLRHATEQFMPWPVRLRWQRRHRQWLLPTLRAEEVAGRGRRWDEGDPGASPLQRLMRHYLLSPQGTLPFEYNGELLAALGVEYRTPYADRRLIELCYQLPAESRIEAGQSRQLFKQAMGARLPPELLARTSKADFTEFTAYALEPADHQRAVAMGDGWLAARGWLDRDVWRLWAEQPPRATLRTRLHSVAHMEAWLATLGQGDSTSVPIRPSR